MNKLSFKIISDIHINTKEAKIQQTDRKRKFNLENDNCTRKLIKRINLIVMYQK